MLHEKAKLQESLGEGLSLGSGFSVKILKLACFVLFVRNGKSHTSKCKGGWRTRGIVVWNHATELLKQHSGSKWHQDSSITTTMAKHVEQQNVMEMQCAGAAKQAEEQKKKNREIILKFMRSIYLLANNLIPHSTTYKELIELQVLATNCLKSILVKLSTHQDSVLGC